MEHPRTRDRLHAAIQSGCWSTAQDLLAAFRLEVEESWRAAETEQERCDISQNVTGFLEWARAMTVTSRAHAAGNVRSLSRRRAYAGVRVPNPHRGLNA
ncbi:MAG TPA: hypothetical protein VGJ09_08690 [Bryobacteraceae bacterium]|jgi:hypothetical protein